MDSVDNFYPQERVPFAVVGSNTIIEGEGGKKSRGRKYPWGVVDIENLQHCDFLPLRNMLIKVLTMLINDHAAHNDAPGEYADLNCVEPYSEQPSETLIISPRRT